MQKSPVNHVNMSDIARHANVSQATVSRIINDKPGFREETRERVFHSLEALGYQSYVSELLNEKKRKKLSLCFLMCPLAEQKNALELPYFDTLAATIGEYLSKRSISMEIKPLRSGAIEVPFARKPDGVFLVGSPAEPLRLNLKKAGIPYVLLLDTETYSDHENCITATTFETGVRACRYLLQQGCRRIGYLSNRQLLSLCAGMEFELEKHGLEIAPRDRHILHSTDAADAVGEICEWLTEGSLPEGMFVNHLSSTRAILPILRKHGVKVPEQLQLITLGVTAGTDEPDPPVPAFFLYPEKQGTLAAKRLLELISNPDENFHHVTVPRILCLPNNKKGRLQ